MVTMQFFPIPKGYVTPKLSQVVQESASDLARDPRRGFPNLQHPLETKLVSRTCRILSVLASFFKSYGCARTRLALAES